MAFKEKEKLWQGLTITFEGEEDLCAGALKTEFFELLLKGVKLHLFEGPDESQISVRQQPAITFKFSRI